MTTLLLLSGSPRCESYNTRLLKYLAQYLDGRCIIDMIDPAQVDLPLFNQDLEVDPSVIERVSMLHQRFEASQGMIVASPEYNGQPTPFLKNIIDWVSRLSYIDNSFDNPFLNRPTLLCSASTGWSGGAVAIPYARALFGYVGCLVIGETICIPNAHQTWSEDGYQFDPFFDTYIYDVTDRALQLAHAFALNRNSQHEVAA
jgi:chromate reductase, NAD(P)H dehydrogenase (quinone)